MRIGELAAQTGASVRSLRYYEEQRLLRPERTPSGQRVFGGEAVARVRLLRRMYNAGLSSTTIASLLPCVDRPSEATTRATIAVMEREHDRLGEQIADLVATRDQLAHLIEAASACAAEPEPQTSDSVASPLQSVWKVPSRSTRA